MLSGLNRRRYIIGAGSGFLSLSLMSVVCFLPLFFLFFFFPAGHHSPVTRISKVLYGPERLSKVTTDDHPALDGGGLAQPALLGVLSGRSNWAGHVEDSSATEPWPKRPAR